MATETDNQHDMHEFPCQGPVRAEIRVRSGALTVTAEERESAAVKVTPYGGTDADRGAADDTVVRFEGDRLYVETPEVDGGWIFRRGGRARVDVRVPLDSHLAAYVGSADVRTAGRLGGATIRSGSGDIALERVAGDLAVESGSGDVHAQVVDGSLSVKTGSGDIRVNSVAGSLTAHVASGDIDIDRATGAVRASTASGDVRVGSASGSQVQVKSASGDVSVGVPTGTKVWLDLNTLSGSTTNNLQMTGAPAEDAPRTEIRVNTLSGDIDVHRVAAGV